MRNTAAAKGDLNVQLFIVKSIVDKQYFCFDYSDSALNKSAFEHDLIVYLRTD